MSTEQIDDHPSPPILHFLSKTPPTSDDHVTPVVSSEDDDDDEQTDQPSIVVQPIKENTTDERIKTVSHSRRVHFPTDDSQLRSYSCATDPFSNRALLSLGAILQRYRAVCQRTQIRPLNCLLDQLSSMDDGRKSFIDRIDCLKIINEKLDLKQIEAIEEILSRCRFHTLDFDSTTIDESALIQLFDILEYYESCTHINFSNNRSFNYQGYQALAKYLRKTNSLERLDMNSMRFDETNIVTFTRSLRLSSTLYELHVESCQLNGKILQKFIEILRSCISLRELYLCDNRLQTQDAILINNLIRTCGPFLYTLDLRSNSLQDAGMSQLASQLSQYDQNHANENSLFKLNLESNQLTQQGVGFLAKALLHNRTIRSLNLSNNNITNEGLFLLRDALLTNRTIQELILRNCRLTDQAAIALAEYIAESTTIQYVDLRGNTIQASGMCGMAIAIKMNKSLLRLDFDPINATPTNFNSLFSTTSIDRTNNFLSLANIRRMTTSLTNSNITPSGGGTRELLEQKARWMNDIEATCQRNIVLYEEKLQQQENLASTETNNELQAQQTDTSLKENSNSNPIDSTEINESTVDNQEDSEQLVNSSADDENPTDLNSSEDNTDDIKPRLEHSDSMCLLRQKVQKDTDNNNTSDDESQLSTIEEHLTDGV